MATTDSRRAGILTPIAASGVDAPEDAMRDWVSGLTGLDSKLVRRRWLPKPGKMPDIGVDWCAVGVLRIKTYGTPYQKSRKGQGSDMGDITRESHQTLFCAASFYGPHAAQLSDAFREGAQVFQNAEELEKSGIKLQGIDDEILHLPDFVHEQWVDRFDVTFRVGRKVTRTYGVRDIANAGDIQIQTEKGTL